ncbi:MAG: metallophosphoesterase [Clostridia bacterium]|nr:metallophosphoesterase [Clostridia bacterium]
MALFVLSDTHLSLSDNKPMDVFGKRWQNYTERLNKSWNAVVEKDDTVVIAGDISWAMSYTGATEDFKFIHALNGKKIIGKGNHDYWWTSMKKLTGLLDELEIDSIRFLYNNALYDNGFIITGSRGWYVDENNKNAPDSADFDKIVAREVIRLEMSLKDGEKLREEHPEAEMLAFLHFPPVMGSFVCRPIVDLLHKYGVKRCYFGHIHSSYELPPHFDFEGIEFYITSADYLSFTPLKIRQSKE